MYHQFSTLLETTLSGTEQQHLYFTWFPLLSFFLKVIALKHQVWYVLALPSRSFVRGLFSLISIDPHFWLYVSLSHGSYRYPPALPQELSCHI